MKLIEKLSLLKRKNKKEKDTDIIRKIRLSIPAQCASITPPLGPALGQFGINVMDFCKQFNNFTKIFESEVMLNVLITLFRNKKFTFVIQRPSISFLVYESVLGNHYKKNLKQNNGSFDESIFYTNFINSTEFLYPNKILISDFYELLKFCKNFTELDEISLAKSIRSSLSSMGVQIIID